MTTAAAPHATARWDLSALFSGIDDPKIRATVQRVQESANRFADKYRGKVGNLSPAELLEAIREVESITNELYKPVTFGHLMFAANTSDPNVAALMQEMQERGSDVQVTLMFFELELQALSEDRAEELIASQELQPYAHWLGRVRALSPYRLSEPEEIVLEKTANVGTRAWNRLHDELTSNHVFRLKRPEGESEEEMSLSEVLDLLRSPDRALRQAAADALTNGLKDLERPLVLTYNTLLLDKKIEDEMRGFEFPQQSRHIANELDRETVDMVMDLCRKHYGLVERFYAVKKSILGLSELTHVDRYAPLFETEERVGFDEAKEIVLSSFRRFSDPVADAAERFFVNSWIDAEPRQGKTGGAFCSGVTPDLHPVVLMNYMNKMDDVMTLAHELGHGVHDVFASKQSLFNYHPTLPMAELASTFGEMLVFDSIVSRATLKDKVALYAEKVEGIFATIFRQSAMYRFESECHAWRREKGELSSDDFGALWQKNLQEMFGASLTLGDQHRIWWSYIPHFVSVPFYVYAYSIGELLVLSLYEMARASGSEFAEKYIEVLSSGGSISPQEMMNIVGVDMSDPDFWEGGFSVLARMVSEFESLWEQFSASGSN